MAQPVLATQGIALERPAGKPERAGGKQGTQRLWWRFREAGGKGDSVSQMQKALSASLGMAIGEVLSQSVAGSTDGALARLQKVGAGLLDSHSRTGLLRSYLVTEGPPADVWASLTDASNRMWAPVLSCAFFAALKVFEGQTGDLLHVCQDKVLVMVISNYVLWPLANALNAHLVPVEHRKIASHIITIIWNAWLSALLSQVAVLGAPAALAGHAGQAVAAAAAGAVGHSATESVMASVDALDVPLVIPDSPFEAISDLATPLLDNVTAALEGASALAHKLPGNLIEKAFSRSLDLINPLRELERTPSQVGLGGADPLHRALQRTATRILQRSDTAAFITSHLSHATTGASSGIGEMLAGVNMLVSAETRQSE